MIRNNKKPSNRSEQMIYNNFVTMRALAEWKTHPLTPALICDMQRLITNDTLDERRDVGDWRIDDEVRVVDRSTGQLFHVPPPAEQIPERMEALCDFANGNTPDLFVHPVIRSIILHFWMAYDHPFGDGKGRTARALFYWSMLRNGYWLFEFISISRIIYHAHTKYYRAFLLTETDENDLTYFIDYHIDIINKAIQELHDYIQRKADEVRAIEQRLQAFHHFNHRQLSLLGHALRNPSQRYTIESHKNSHSVTYQTARTDLMALEKAGLLRSHKIGKKLIYVPEKNFTNILNNKISDS